MRQTCIQHPTRDPLIIIRKWQVELCKGNHCAAALLSFFEYWHGIRSEQAIKAAEENVVAMNHSEEPKQNTSLMQFHTADQLHDGIIGLFSGKTITAAINQLVAMGFVTVHRNPNSRYKFDCTKHFLLNCDAVNAASEAGKTRSRKNDQTGLENYQPGSQFYQPGLENSKITNSPKITTKITTESTRTFSHVSSEPKNQNGKYHPDTLSALSFLNDSVGRHYREVDANLGIISQRLREPGVDLAGVKTMIARQCQKWKGSTMEDYLRPETLFRKSKFDSYYAAKDADITEGDGDPKPKEKEMTFFERAQYELDAGITM